ncbi:ring-cleaving dioxygenase [Bacillus thermotolerans]|uniref:ring-cleaving dioxygenase n=1 Tax=Bacillus thermotolerans TaxID=1221996 RepID=UPI000580A225|nr:ring-cleaving dioxygenase [Bacillus thermotolerans]KKB38307.1 Glyoxalase family protein [Bacillus thermotolerans]
MNKQTLGIHHITAIVGDPQENVDFYTNVLGLRLVKRTINFDDPGTYHFYFGDEEGTPGTIITFFPWNGAHQGVIGDGQVGVTTYAVPTGALSFWAERLSSYNVPCEKINRFGEEILSFADPHGLKLELVERAERLSNTWSFNGVPSDMAIQGFAGAVLYSAAPEQTAHLLEKVMGLEKAAEEVDYTRFRSRGDIGNTVDIKKTSSGRGRMGVGTVHHIAWRADDDKDQLEWRGYLEENGYRATPVQPRQYFNSIYFRERGHILFEIATDEPGFLIDERKESLGAELKLPEWYEPQREKIEQLLQPIEVRETDKKE